VHTKIVISNQIFKTSMIALEEKVLEPNIKGFLQKKRGSEFRGEMTGIQYMTIHLQNDLNKMKNRRQGNRRIENIFRCKTL